MTIEIPSALSAQREPLISGLNTLGLDGDRLSEPLLQYLALMLKWNATYNLTAITEPYEMVVKHVLDSAAMHASVRDLAAQGGSIADLGAGAGLPGIVLSVIYPELHVTMLESAGKKVRFMREAIRQLGLPHARAEHVRIEDIAAHLYTRGQPDPDLVIRTSGEQRIGGFLLWQSTHSEFYFCEAYWPDFRRVDFLRALRAYAERDRRFGS